MASLRLPFRLAVGTLRSRPTLTILAIGLLTLGTSVLSGVFGSIYLLQSLQEVFLSGLNVELELSPNVTDSVRANLMEEAESWPGAEFVQFVSPELSLQEMQNEMQEDLLALFGNNPFPPLIRVKFSNANPKILDSLTQIAVTWESVTSVVYPRKLWDEISRLLTRFTGRLSYFALGIAVISVILVGLCMRAQVRNRGESWELLSIFGMGRNTFTLTLLMQAIVLGFFGGLLACLLLWLMTAVYGWLFLRTVTLPFWFYFSTHLSAYILAILSGMLSPRKIG